MRKKHCSIGCQPLLEPIRVETVLCLPDPSKPGLGLNFLFNLPNRFTFYISHHRCNVFILRGVERLKQVRWRRASDRAGFHADCICVGHRGVREESFFTVTKLSLYKSTPYSNALKMFCNITLLQTCNLSVTAQNSV